MRVSGTLYLSGQGRPLLRPKVCLSTPVRNYSINYFAAKKVNSPSKPSTVLFSISNLPSIERERGGVSPKIGIAASYHKQVSLFFNVNA